MFTTMGPLFAIVGLAVVAVIVVSRKKLRNADTYVKRVTAAKEIEGDEEVLNETLDLMARRGETEDYQLGVLRNMKALGNLPPCLKDLDLTNLATVRSTLNASLATRDASR